MEETNPWKIIALILFILIIVVGFYYHSQSQYQEGINKGSNDLIEKIINDGQQCKNPIILSSGTKSASFVWTQCLANK